MPIFSLSILDSLIPANVLKSMPDLSIKQVIERVKSVNYRPQTLFELDTPQKSYRVWIE
ncbi:MAG: hypothetical protein ACI9QD_000903 [Thermoproteota archaeon]|jgi:hypothetical protein